MPSYKTLRRSRTDRMLGGVCAGVARYLGIDPVAARVLFVLAAIITGGALLIAYPVMWAVIPAEPVWPATPAAAPTMPTPTA
jgi:phage shock protein C